MSLILDILKKSLAGAARFNADVQTAPVCILWPDHDRQWMSIISALQSHLPQLLIFGEYAPQQKKGPAIWLKCMIARTLPEADWPEDLIPIIYLPGVGRADLRAIESCSKELQPLAELQYRGAFWSQKNGKDWTLFAFLRSREGGVGLDVAHDEQTLEAIRRAFSTVLQTPIQDLQGRRLEAMDFDALLSPDSVKALLMWLNDPVATRSSWTNEEWEAFESVCKASFKFSPSSDGELTGAELLVKGEGRWDDVWSRFAEAPELYPNLPDLLRRTEPPFDLFTDKERWPQINDGEEKSLREELQKIAQLAPHEGRVKITELEKQHGKRRKWVWARTGAAPLSQAIRYLADLAVCTEKSLAGETPEELRASYVSAGWQVDRAVLKALSMVTKADDVSSVHGAVRSLYWPWLEDSAIRLQKAVGDKGYPSVIGPIPDQCNDGECVLFIDGLRYDIAHMLKELAESRACQIELSSSWAAIPTVTATTKPAVSPISSQISGTKTGEDFVPQIKKTGKNITPYNFKKMLEEEGWQVCVDGETGDPKGKAWCETGAIDRQGHEQGWKLARRIGEEIDAAVEYIERLLEAGWKSVKIVTDHGWLLLPGGLPKADLAKFLTETRWGRCAILKDTTKTDDPVIFWHWSKDVHVAVPHGIGCYTAGREYDHGGLTLQECMIPVMTVKRPEGIAVKANITEHIWRGLRCKVVVRADTGGLRFDVRTKAADSSTSVVKGGKQIDETGSVSVIVEDDDLMGAAAFLVVLSPDGSVIVKESTTIGEG